MEKFTSSSSLFALMMSGKIGVWKDTLHTECFISSILVVAYVPILDSERLENVEKQPKQGDHKIVHEGHCRQSAATLLHSKPFMVTDFSSISTSLS